MRVSGLSPAGEQYIDFSADSDAGPFLSDGSVIAQGRATVPVSLAELLAHADGALAQVDTGQTRDHQAGAEPEQARAAEARRPSSTAAPSCCRRWIPCYRRPPACCRNSRVVLTLAADKNAGIAVASDNLSDTLRGHQPDARRLPHGSPSRRRRRLTAVDNLFADNSDTMVQLLGSLATTSQLLYLRVPALNALFPDYRTSVLDAIGSVMHDNGLWATGDIYPRYACDYGTPRRPPSSADYPEPFMYTYCRDDDPGVLVRGAKNAPRPAGDDTAGPPPGADLGRTTDPTPKGRFTIPTPYGGPCTADRATPLNPPTTIHEEMTVTVSTKQARDDRRGDSRSAPTRPDVARGRSRPKATSSRRLTPTPMTRRRRRRGRRSERRCRGRRPSVVAASTGRVQPPSSSIAARCGLGRLGLEAVAAAGGDAGRPAGTARPRSPMRRS